MSLCDGIIGNKYSVLDINLNTNVKRRLQALGLTVGTKIQILNSKKNGSVIMKVRGTRLAVGKEISKGIIVVDN